MLEDLALSRRLVELNPDLADRQRDLAHICVRLARLEFRAGHLPRALPLYQEAHHAYAALSRHPTSFGNLTDEWQSVLAEREVCRKLLEAMTRPTGPPGGNGYHPGRPDLPPAATA